MVQLRKTRKIDWDLGLRNQERKETCESAPVVPLKGELHNIGEEMGRIESRKEERKEAKHLRGSGGFKTLTWYSLRLAIL